MKENEYMVDLTIHKEIIIKASSIEEAKEKAIEAAQFMGHYYALEIEDVRRIERYEKI